MSAIIAAAIVVRTDVPFEARVSAGLFWQQFSTDRTPTVQNSREAQHG